MGTQNLKFLTGSAKTLSPFLFSQFGSPRNFPGTAQAPPPAHAHMKWGHDALTNSRPPISTDIHPQWTEIFVALTTPS